METAPGKVIRSLRQALDMTQAEFARAAGWSTSTISSWERGTARPSRLAFKTILAFAEERGVRYQPKGDRAATSPAPASNGGSTLPVLRLSSRLPSPPPPIMADAQRQPPPGARAESFGSRRWTEVAANIPTATFEAAAASPGARPDWRIEASMHLKIGAASERLRRTGYVVASLAALAVGLGAGILLRTGSGVEPVRDLGSARALERSSAVVPPVAAGVPQEAASVEVDELATVGLAAPVAPGPPLAAEPLGQDAEASRSPVRPPPAPAYARLESIVALDGVRRASFRVGDRSIALVQGDELGGRAVAEIANDEVMLVGDGGALQRVRLGFETPLE